MSVTEGCSVLSQMKGIVGLSDPERSNHCQEFLQVSLCACAYFVTLLEQCPQES